MQGGSLQLARDARSMAGSDSGSDLSSRLASTHAALKRYLRRDEDGLGPEE